MLEKGSVFDRIPTQRRLSSAPPCVGTGKNYVLPIRRTGPIWTDPEIRSNTRPDRCGSGVLTHDHTIAMSNLPIVMISHYDVTMSSYYLASIVLSSLWHTIILSCDDTII